MPLIRKAVLCLLMTVATTYGAPDVSYETRTIDVHDSLSLTIDYGRLTVAENRSNPDSRDIEIAFARVHSLSEQPLSPVFYLAGGPGGWSTYYADSPRSLRGWAELLAVCDVVFIDQRGTGRSGTGMTYDLDWQIPDGYFLSEEIMLDAYIAAAQEGIPEIKKHGVDLSGYTTVESADDLNDLRAALGYESMTLLGFSYGTHLAMATMRRHPEHTSKVIVVGVEGLHQTHKLPLDLDTFFKRLCLQANRDTVVSRHVPDMLQLYKDVLAQLEHEPLMVKVYDDDAGRIRDIPVGPWGLQYILRRDIGDASDTPVFPKLLHSISQRDPSVLQWFVQKRWPPQRFFAMPWLVDGASGATEGRWSLILEQEEQSLFGGAANFPWPEFDAATGAVDLGDEFRAPLVSDIPTLLLTGTHDWNTPPYQAEQIRQGLANGVHIVVENAGHEQILPHPQVKETVVRFLQGDDVRDVDIATDPIEFVPIDRYDPDRMHASVGPAQDLNIACLYGGADSLRRVYDAVTRVFPEESYEWTINSLGYMVLNTDGPKAAIPVFELNTQAHPQSANAWDSYAEAHMKAGQPQQAIEYYRKSLSLNPDNDNARKMLSELGDSEG